ncbi:MAG: M56 family metallopeptidase [Akkermansiaceae bacterium]
MFLPSLLFSLLTASAIWLLTRRHPARDPRLVGAAMTLLLLLPLLSFAPKFTVSVPTVALGESTTSWVFFAWLAGFLFFSVRKASDFIAMRRWKKESSACDLDDLFSETQSELGFNKTTPIRIHPELASPVVTGLLSPTIYLPVTCTEWSKKTLKMALLHELSHVQRRDLWMALLADLACLVHWFNPAVWWMRSTLLTQCEYACDAHLLEKGADPKSYANALCDVAESSSLPPLSLAMAGHAPLRERIQQIASPKSGRSIWLGIFIVAISVPAIAMSVIRFAPEIFPSYSADEIEMRFSAAPFPGDA